MYNTISLEDEKVQLTCMWSRSPISWGRVLRWLPPRYSNLSLLNRDLWFWSLSTYLPWIWMSRVSCFCCSPPPRQSDLMYKWVHEIQQKIYIGFGLIYVFLSVMWSPLRVILCCQITNVTYYIHVQVYTCTRICKSSNMVFSTALHYGIEMAMMVFK